MDDQAATEVVDQYLTWAIPKPRDEYRVQDPPTSRWSIAGDSPRAGIGKAAGPHQGAPRLGLHAGDLVVSSTSVSAPRRRARSDCVHTSLHVLVHEATVPRWRRLLPGGCRLCRGSLGRCSFCPVADVGAPRGAAGILGVEGLAHGAAAEHAQVRGDVLEGSGQLPTCPRAQALEHGAGSLDHVVVDLSTIQHDGRRLLEQLLDLGRSFGSRASAVRISRVLPSRAAM